MSHPDGPITYGRQNIDDADVRAVTEVLRGDWLTQGPAVERFEEALATRVGARHAVAVVNATEGLFAAAAATGIGPGDLVATSPLTFIASANCARYVGADVALVDIERRTLNLDPAAVPGDVRAVVPVHYAGLPVELERLARDGRVVIEDAAHALGASTPDGPIGACAHSDACVFSFHPVKPITTGEGGAITTNDDGLADELRRFRNHGITRTPEAGGWSYRIDRIGHNLRMTDLQAALGWSQLSRLDAFIARRNELAERYRALLAGWPIELPPAAPPGTVHGYHLFAVQVPDRRAVYDALHAEDVRVQVHYVPVHHHPIGAGDRRPVEGLPVCDAVYAGLLSLPLHPSLTDAQQDRVVAALERALGR